MISFYDMSCETKMTHECNTKASCSVVFMKVQLLYEGQIDPEAVPEFLAR